MTYILGIDDSHWNAAPNYPQLHTAGNIQFVFSKGTDGVGYLDPTMAARRVGVKGAGMIWGPYHFAEWGDPIAEANYYLAHAAPQPGELVGLDLEAKPPAGFDPVAWAVAWSRRVHDQVGAYPLAYMNQSWANGHNWAPLIALGDALWLAKYDGSAVGTPLAGWPVLAMKQFSDSAVVPGQPGAIDEDAFEGTVAQLQKYTVPRSTPTPIPAPTPTPGDGFDVGYSQWTQADKDALLSDINTKVWTTPVQPPAPALTDSTWPLDRLRGIDYKTGVLTGAPAVNAAAVVSALVASADFQALITQAAQAAATGAAQNVVAAMDADLAKRFGS